MGAGEDVGEGDIVGVGVGTFKGFVCLEKTCSIFGRKITAAIKIIMSTGTAAKTKPWFFLIYYLYSNMYWGQVNYEEFCYKYCS